MKKHRLILLLFVLVYLVNGIFSINAISITSDEGSHLAFGIKMLKGDLSRTNPEKDNSKMPISALNAIPRAVEQLFNPNLSKSDWGVDDTVKGRYVTLAFSILIILLVYRFSSKLFGVNAGLFSAFLFICCPNNMAAAVLVTTDSYSVFFLLSTMYLLWRYCNTGERRHLIGFAVALGLSQLVKQSLFHLYMLAPLIICIFATATHQRLRILTLLKNVLIVISINWVLINAGFLFWHMNLRLGDYHFMSVFFQKIGSVFPSGMPVPMSESFVSGLDQAKYYDQVGGGSINSSFGNVTILGHSSNGGSFWYYYFVTLFFKTPITYLVLFIWAIYLSLKKERLANIIRNDLFLLAPIIYFLILFSFLYKTQCGVRHIIFFYPLIFIYCGRVYKYATGKKARILLSALCIFLVVSVGRYFNNYFPYTNEFILQKKNAYSYVGAANLNFDQAGYLISDYLKRHPEVKMAPEQPEAGKFVLMVDYYLDVWNTGKYLWIRKLKPVGEVHYSYLLFDVQQKDIQP